MAAEKGITKENAEDLNITTDVLGDNYVNMLQDALAAVGNYDEIYEQYFGDKLPEKGLNAVNVDGTPNLYALF